MPLKNKNTGTTESDYRLRILISIVLVELLALGVFNLWPIPDEGDKTLQDVTFTDENVVMEDVQITRQESRPPPPPKPQVPIPVPNDEVVEEEPLELQDIDISDYADAMEMESLGDHGDSEQVVSNPQIGPSVVRIVEPTIPEEAKKANIKVEVWVNFLVNKNGDVEEASISQIRLYDQKNDEFRTIETIGYGITESTLKAALQWKFRPARHGNEIVRAYTKHIFTYGF